MKQVVMTIADRPTPWLLLIRLKLGLLDNGLGSASLLLLSNAS